MRGGGRTATSNDESPQPDRTIRRQGKHHANFLCCCMCTVTGADRTVQVSREPPSTIKAPEQVLAMGSMQARVWRRKLCRQPPISGLGGRTSGLGPWLRQRCIGRLGPCPRRAAVDATDLDPAAVQHAGQVFATIICVHCQALVSDGWLLMRRTTWCWRMSMGLSWHIGRRILPGSVMGH